MGLHLLGSNSGCSGQAPAGRGPGTSARGDTQWGRLERKSDGAAENGPNGGGQRGVSRGGGQRGKQWEGGQMGEHRKECRGVGQRGA